MTRLSKILEKEQLKQEPLKQEQLKEQRFGNYFHALMSQCNLEDQVDGILSDMIKKGEIDPEFKTELSNKACEFFRRTTPMFEDVVEIINEQLILIPGDKDKRPDRIILKKDELIVFEFKTGKQSDQHH